MSTSQKYEIIFTFSQKNANIHVIHLNSNFYHAKPLITTYDTVQMVHIITATHQNHCDNKLIVESQHSYI
jgi:hypothetical protein